jgi:TupA-like ATPgrasp
VLKMLSAMIETAKIPSEDFLFVRVDFHEIKASPRFGGLTYYPGSGFESLQTRHGHSRLCRKCQRRGWPHMWRCSARVRRAEQG